jgi:hypothetical protein
MYIHTELYFIHIVTSFLCFSTELYFMYSVTSFFMLHYTQLYFMYIVTHEVQLCLVKYKKEVTMYMKDSSVCSET